MGAIKIDPGKYTDREMQEMGISRSTIRRARHKGLDIELDDEYVAPLRGVPEDMEALCRKAYWSLYHRINDSRTSFYYEDLLQEGRLALWRQSWHPQCQESSGYRLAIAKRAMKDHYIKISRWRKSDAKINNPCDEGEAIEFADTGELIAQLRAAVGDHRFNLALQGDLWAQEQVKEIIWTSG